MYLGPIKTRFRKSAQIIRVLAEIISLTRLIASKYIGYNVKPVQKNSLINLILSNFRCHEVGVLVVVGIFNLHIWNQRGRNH